MTCSTPTPDSTPYSPERYYSGLAAAFVRGHLQLGSDLAEAEVLSRGAEAGLRLHKFKRTTLPRVQRVVGALRGLYPSSLLDLGTGRGTFLWPLLDAFPGLPITAVDVDPRRVTDLQAVARGGVGQLTALEGTALGLEAERDAFDGVTVLEVLEHLADPFAAAREVLRVAGRFVIASVPSKADDNPEHIQLFTKRSLSELFLEAGAERVSVDYVLNHMIAVVRV